MSEEDRRIDGLKIEIDPEAINRYVADAVLRSALGEHVREAVSAALTRSSYGGRSAMQDAIVAEVHQQVRLYARELVRTEYQDKVREAIAERLTPEKIGEIADRFVEQLGLITKEDMSY